MGLAFYEVGKPEEANKHFQLASHVNPAWPEALNQEAWTLATSPDPKMRHGHMALLVARQVCRATGNREPRSLDTLAAAYAETGQFDQAVETAKQAVVAAKKTQAEYLAPAIQERLEQYQRAQPYRSPSKSSAH